MRRSLAPILVLSALAACPAGPDPNAIPDCEELGCAGGTVCLDGACRPRGCLEVVCEEGTVCQADLQCRSGFEDRDGDGARAQLDCDDDDATRIPFAFELCDGVDNDCDGLSDDEAPCAEGARCCGEAGCVDPTDNRSHCGGCGTACALYDECIEGRCVEAPEPVLEGISPDPLPAGEWVEVVLSGLHLVGYATVYVESGGVEAAPFEVIARDDGVYYTDQPVRIDGARVPPGRASLFVVRNDGLRSNAIDFSLEGAPPPVIEAFSPDPLPVGEETTVSVTGTGFWGSTRVLIAPDELDAEWRDIPVEWASDSWLRSVELILDPLQHPAGPWLAVARNPDDVESAPFPFTVDAAAPPGLTSVIPAQGALDTTVELEVLGYGMFGEPDLFLASETSMDRPVGPLPLASSEARRLVTEPILLDGGSFSTGRHLLWAVNPDGAESNRVPFLVVN